MGLTVNTSKSAYVGSSLALRMTVGVDTVFDRGEDEPLEYLGFPILRKERLRRIASFRKMRSTVYSFVADLYKMPFHTAVEHINRRLAPRIAYVAKLVTLTKTELKQLDPPIMRVLMRHPGRHHVGSIHKGALYSLLRVQFPSVVAFRARVYHCNEQPFQIPCRYVAELRLPIPLPMPRYRLKAALNAFFYDCYTARWLNASSGQLAGSCPPIIQEVHRLPPRRKAFALAFLTNTLATPHTMTRVQLHNSPTCSCQRGPCTSRHILRFHAQMPLQRIHWKRLMLACRGLLLRLPI